MDCHYLGVDISETMVALARERLRAWASRAEIVLSAESAGELLRPDQGRRPLRFRSGAGSPEAAWPVEIHARPRSRARWSPPAID